MSWLMFFAGTTTGMFLCIVAFLWIAKENRAKANDLQERELRFREDLMGEWEERNRIGRIEAEMLTEVAGQIELLRKGDCK